MCSGVKTERDGNLHCWCLTKMHKHFASVFVSREINLHTKSQNKSLTRHKIRHFGGSVHSQLLDWYWQTKQYRKIHKLNTTQKIKQRKNTANKSTMVQLPLTTLSQETRWAHSTTLPVVYDAQSPFWADPNFWWLFPFFLFYSSRTSKFGYSLTNKFQLLGDFVSQTLCLPQNIHIRHWPRPHGRAIQFLQSFTI